MHEASAQIPFLPSGTICTSASTGKSLTGWKVSMLQAEPSQCATTPSPVFLDFPPTQTSESDRARML